MLPLFFQVVLFDSASQAGGRLAIPALATPVGGLIAGFIMSRYGKLITLLRSGVTIMTLGNALVTSLSFSDSTWKYYLFIFPAGLGQGITYPSTLFTNIATFEHSGMPMNLRTRAHTDNPRSCCFRVHGIFDPQYGLRLGRCHHIGDRADSPEVQTTRGAGGRERQGEGRQ
jgi:hypothetical protein